MDTFAGLFFQPTTPSLTHLSSITNGVVPKDIHSHNDYWRQTPLFDALSYGCKSIEADIYLVGSGKKADLLVGHKAISLSHSWTLKSMYLDPLEKILESQNQLTALAANEPGELINGVWSSYDPTETVQLVLDYKNDGATLHPFVLSYLSHFRSLNLLSTYDEFSGNYTIRPITVVCTGNCPLSLVQAQYPRDVFYDAPLDQLDNVDYGWEVAPMASMSLRKLFGSLGALDLKNKKRVKEIKRLVKIAKEKGIKPRFWDAPSWPAYKRDSIWRTLRAAGIDYLNADNLKAASKI